MSGKVRKSRKTETAEETLDRWLAGAVKGFGYSALIEAGWEPGQVSHITVDGVNYEKFPVSGGYTVVDWDDDGNVGTS